MTDHVKNVVIVGASGNIGSNIVAALSEVGGFNITAVTRPQSTASFPAHVTAKKLAYDDEAGLAAAFAGQEVLIFCLGFMIEADYQSVSIRAAAQAQVPYVFLNEWGSDPQAAELQKLSDMNAAKRKYPKLVEELGFSSWIGVVTNPWFDFAMPTKFYKIDPDTHKATLYDGGNTKFNGTTLKQVGRAVAKLLSLPASGASPALSDYKNRAVYIRSFVFSQRDLLAAFNRATGQTEADWMIEHDTTDNLLAQAQHMEGMQKPLSILLGATLKEGLANQYRGPLFNDAVGLPEENLDEAVAKFLKEGINSKLF